VGLLLLKVTKPSLDVSFRVKIDTPIKLFKVTPKENNNGDVNKGFKYVDGRIAV
jgi:hypothetical protein